MRARAAFSAFIMLGSGYLTFWVFIAIEATVTRTPAIGTADYRAAGELVLRTVDPVLPSILGALVALAVLQVADVALVFVRFTTYLAGIVAGAWLTGSLTAGMVGGDRGKMYAGVALGALCVAVAIVILEMLPVGNPRRNELRTRRITTYESDIADYTVNPNSSRLGWDLRGPRLVLLGWYVSAALVAAAALASAPPPPYPSIIAIWVFVVGGTVGFVGFFSILLEVAACRGQSERARPGWFLVTVIAFVSVAYALMLSTLVPALLGRVVLLCWYAFVVGSSIAAVYFRFASWPSLPRAMLSSTIKYTQRRLDNELRLDAAIRANQSQHAPEIEAPRELPKPHGTEKTRARGSRTLHERVQATWREWRSQ